MCLLPSTLIIFCNGTLEAPILVLSEDGFAYKPVSAPAGNLVSAISLTDPEHND